METSEPAIDLRLALGAHPRTLLVTARSDPGRLPPSPDFDPERTPTLDAATLVSRWARAVSAGCLGPASSSAVVASDIRQEGSARIERWTVSCAALPPEAFGPLVTMARFARFFGSSLESLAIEERGVTDARAVDIAALRPLPSPKPRFPVDLPEDPGKVLKDGRAVVTFASPVTGATLERVSDVFEAWAGILMGGFPGDRWPASAGFVVDVVQHLPTEVVAPLEFVNATLPAWEALLRALVAIDASSQPIARVEIY